MEDRIELTCNIAGEKCNVRADRKEFPGHKGPCYSLGNEGKWLGYICRHVDGYYKALDGSSLTQDDIDAIGEQIDSVQRL